MFLPIGINNTRTHFVDPRAAELETLVLDFKIVFTEGFEIENITARRITQFILIDFHHLLWLIYK